MLLVDFRLFLWGRIFYNIIIIVGFPAERYVPRAVTFYIIVCFLIYCSQVEEKAKMERKEKKKRKKEKKKHKKKSKSRYFDIR